MGLQFRGVVKGVFNFHTIIEGGMGSLLTVTSDNCSDRHLLREGLSVVLELDEDREEWVLVEESYSGS